MAQRKAYRSDLTDAQLKRIKPVLRQNLVRRVLTSMPEQRIVSRDVNFMLTKRA